MRLKLLLFFAWMSVAAGAQQLTNIPTVYITTEGGQGIYDKENYVPGTVTIESDNPDFAVSGKTMGIRGRGNSTWGFAKKPYRIKFDKKINLFNRPAKAKSWVLLANYADKTLLRNGLAFELSRFVGFDFSPSAVFADVVLNGEYLGNYTVSDQIQINQGRVEIDEMDETCIEGESLTGGYFLEIDGFGNSEPVHFSTSHGLTITVKSPDEDVIQTVQLNYIKNFINDFEKALFGTGFDNPEGGFRVKVDEKSLVDWYICCELTGNSDSFWSTYIYKKRSDDKLYFGPLWDFDIAFNNDNRLGDAVNKLMRNNAHEPRTWITRMWQAQWFRTAVYQRWCELIDMGMEDFMIDYITASAELIDQSQSRNFAKWGNINRRVYLEQFLFNTYAEGVNYLKRYVHERISFLDESFRASGSISEVENIVPGAEYYILHYVGLYATPQPSNFYIMNPDPSIQKLKFVKNNNEGTWSILTHDGRYVASTSNDKYCVYTQNSSDPHAQFVVEHSPYSGFAKIKNIATGLYLGVEHTAHYSRISTNKSGNDVNHAWKVLPVDRTNSIEAVKTDCRPIFYDASCRLIRMAQPSQLSVYSIDGKLMLSYTAAETASMAILAPGVYIARTGDGFSVKFAVK